MTIFKGSRYEKSKYTTIKNTDGSIKKYVHPRTGFSCGYTDGVVRTIKNGELFDEIMYYLTGKEEDWYILAEVNGIPFPLDLEYPTDLILPV